jgi:hypothetical protein
MARDSREALSSLKFLKFVAKLSLALSPIVLFCTMKQMVFERAEAKVRVPATKKVMLSSIMLSSLS